MKDFILIWREMGKHCRVLSKGRCEGYNPNHFLFLNDHFGYYGENGFGGRQDQYRMDWGGAAGANNPSKRCHWLGPGWRRWWEVERCEFLQGLTQRACWWLWCWGSEGARGVGRSRVWGWLSRMTGISLVPLRSPGSAESQFRYQLVPWWERKGLQWAGGSLCNSPGQPGACSNQIKGIEILFIASKYV